ncbi:hypothetical protein [Streptomyces sp. NBRC 109706]|uniref:hypothetical protein n=1 Tax=Streptomyces sp. NBRC 109706 TaxID=1550035 RepID=UPI000784DFED|nr:hypothetical protein [Streptomyces sp. NBRC 109706]
MSPHLSHTVEELTLTDTTAPTQETDEPDVRPQDHYVSSEPKVPGHKPERDDPKAEAEEGEENDEPRVKPQDHYVSSEPKDKPGPIAPVDHYVS